MSIPLKSVYEALGIHGVTPEGELSHGVRRHNDSITDGSSVFIKVLGETNGVDSFHRELGVAKIFPHAPQPLISEVIFVDLGRGEKPRWKACTAWVFYDGVDVLAKDLSAEQAKDLCEQLNRLYSSPVTEADFPLPDIHFEAVSRRMKQAEEFIPTELEYVLEDINRLIENTRVRLEEATSSELKRVLIHGDPHLGNVISLTDEAKSRAEANGATVGFTGIMLLDYESMKHAPIEYDLACLYQDLVQVHDNPEAYKIIRECFQRMSLDLHGQPLNEGLLLAYIQFRNVSTLTYLLAFQDWDLVKSRLNALLPLLTTNVLPLRLQSQVLAPEQG